MASSIQQFLNKILSSRYGKDVRQAIHDGIKQCYSDVTNPDLNVDAFETAVQNKIDSGALAAMTIADGSITKEKLDQDITENIETNTQDITNLKSAMPKVDTTLSNTGEAADAKVTGDIINSLSDDIEQILQKVNKRTLYMGDITENVYKINNFAVKTNEDENSNNSESKVWEVNPGDLLLILIKNHDDISNALFRCITIYDYDHEKISHYNYSSGIANYITIPENGAYVLVNTMFEGSGPEVKIYRNNFTDLTYMDDCFPITEDIYHKYKINGIVTSSFAGIKYKKGYYVAHTNLHETINTPTVGMRNGDIVYYDGETFTHIESKGTLAKSKNKHYNVVIVGSGASGISTALNLIDSGMNVAIIEKNKHLGGTHTCAGVIDLCPSPVDESLKNILKKAWNDGYSRFSSFNYQYGDGDKFDKLWNGSHINYQNDSDSYKPKTEGNHIMIDKYYMEQYYYETLTSSGIDVYLNTEITDVMTDGNYIRAVTDSCGNIYNADFFVDGDSAIIKMAGEKNVDYFIGYDGSLRFGESKCNSEDPDENNINQIVFGTITRSTNADQSAGKCPDIIMPFDSIIATSGGGWNAPRAGAQLGDNYKSQDWVDLHPFQNNISNGVYIQSYACHLGADSIGITGEEYIHNGVDYIYAKYKNKALHQGTSGNVLPNSEVNEMLGIREGYRLAGIYTGTQIDCETLLTELGDKSILSSWYYESHSPSNLTPPLFRSITGIPITAMMSKKFKNYLNPSKGKSVSHLAHSTFRLMRTCWLSGRLAAEILKSVWETTNNVTGADVSTINDNSGVNELFEQIKTYI